MKQRSKPALLLLSLCLLACHSWAQPGLDEMQQARQDLTGSFFSTLDAALALATLLGLIGAVRVYHDWQMGQRHITSAVAGWFYAALFMVLMGAFLRAVLGI